MHKVASQHKNTKHVLTKKEKADKGAADKAAKKAEKKRLKEEAKEAKRKAKEEAKAAKIKLKADKKAAKNLGITYAEFAKREARKIAVAANKAKAAAEKERLENESEEKDDESEGSGPGEDDGNAVNLLDMAVAEVGTPTAPAVKSQPNQLKTPKRSDSSDSKKDVDATKETKEQKRAQPLFGKKMEVAASPTRQQKDYEKSIQSTKPLMTRRRKLIAAHSTVFDLTTKDQLASLKRVIANYEVQLKNAPRDPIIEPKHRKAYQQHARLLKELPPPHWGKLNSVGGAIKFYKINLYLQRLTSLKLFPANGECPFLEDERDSYSENIDWRCIQLNCSVNSIAKIKNVVHMIHLRVLDLSSNHILTIGNTLCTMVELRELNLSNNSIVRIEGLEKCKFLVKLNLHGNKIPKIENLNGGTLKKLTTIDLGGNQLTRVEHLRRLPSLTDLDLSRNEIINAEELAFVPQLTDLKISQNHLDNLVEFGRSIVGLTNLQRLKLDGNPICNKRDYRLRVLENPSIVMLDDVEIKPRLRSYLQEMSRRAHLEDIMEATTQDYMDRIAAEREVKSDNMELLRRSQLELEGAFGKYREEMENELQECISYIHSLDVRDDLIEKSTLSTPEGMGMWKEKLMAAQIRRDRAKRAYVRKQQSALLQQTAHTSEALKYTDKLKELADERPGIWREMKRRELGARTMEQKLQHKEDQSIAKDRRNYQKDQLQVRESRERAMLEAVDQIEPAVEAWWDPDAEKRDVTVEHLHRHEAEHRNEIKRAGSSKMDGITSKEGSQGGDSDGDSVISIHSNTSSTASKGSKSSKNGVIKKKTVTKIAIEKDVNQDSMNGRKKTSAKSRYRVKFGPGKMGIKLVDRLPEEGTGVCVKGMVEGQKAAQTGKIKVGDILYRVNADNVLHMNVKQILTKIGASARPIQLEFDRPEIKKSAKKIPTSHAGTIYTTLFEKGKIGIVWEEETRPGAGG